MQKLLNIADGRISAYEVEYAICKAFNINLLKRIFYRIMGKSIYISDEYYNAVNIDELKKFLAQDDEDKKEYIPVDHDCDDFSFQLMGRIHELNPSLAFGIVWIQSVDYGHALNFAIDKNKQLWFVEPQNDNVFKDKPKDWELILAII